MMKTVITILKKKKYFAIFVILTIFFLVLFVAIPVYLIIGNDVAFQLSTYSILDYILLVILSTLSGLMFTLQIYKWKHGKKICNTAISFAHTTSAGASGILASVIGTSVCVGCIAPIIAFFGFGFGAVSFILSYQLYFSFFAILIIFGSVYIITRGINKF